VPWKKVSITDIWKAKSDKELNYIIHWCSGLPWDDVWDYRAWEVPRSAAQKSPARSDTTRSI